MVSNILKKVLFFVLIALLSFEPIWVKMVVAQEASPSAQLVLDQPESSQSATLVVAPEPVSTPSAQPAEPAPIWQLSGDNTHTTLSDVILDTVYKAPQNEKVTVTFSKLPPTAGKLSIKEVKLTPEQVQKTAALSDTAYDISSTMEDGTFEYTLTLPAPKTQNIEVKASEDGQTFVTLGGVTAQTDTVTITGLDHFTIFVLVDNVNNNTPANLTDDVGNGVLTTIADTYLDQFNPDSNFDTSVDGGTSLFVQSLDDGVNLQNQRTLIRFDTTTLGVGKTVSQATLRLFMDSRPEEQRTYDIYRVTQLWIEDVVTWNNQPTTSPLATSSSLIPSSSVVFNSTWIEFDVTADVQSFINGTATNHGWLIRDQQENDISGAILQTTFRSREDFPGNILPQLVVDFASSTQNNQYKSPTAQAPTTGGVGNGFENNPANVFADAGSQSITASGRCLQGQFTGLTGFASNCNGPANRHIFSGFGFDLLSGAKIDGIEARVDWWLDSTFGTNSLSLELSPNGGLSWTAAKTDVIETVDEHIISFGSSSDTWGRTWASSELSNANFRVRVTSNAQFSTRDFFLDWLPVRVYYTGDGTPPIGSWVSPAASSTVSGVVGLLVSASDAGSGVASVAFSYRLASSTGSFTAIDTDLTSPYTAAWDTTGLALDTYTLRAVVTDNAGNITTVDRSVDVGAIISAQVSNTASFTSINVSWNTDRPTTGRVVYDTISHPTLGDAPNYGYAFSTGEFDTNPKAISHNILIGGLSSGTLHYYRTISTGSPVTISEEKGAQTFSIPGAGSPPSPGGAAPAPSPATTTTGQILGVATAAPLAQITQPVVFPELEEPEGEEVRGATTPTQEAVEVEPKPQPNLFTLIWNFLISIFTFLLKLLPFV